MRKFLPLVTLLFSFTHFSYAQNNWEHQMHDRTANFFDIQADFQIYYDSIMVGQTSIPKGKGIKQFKRWEYYWEARVDEDGNFPTPGNTLQEVYRYQDDNANRAYLTGTGTWEIVGPVPSPANGTGQPNGNGRVNCIEFHPTDANALYVGAPSGGFWKSTDNGATWTEYSNGLTRLGVSSIIVHPTNTNTIYIGTGDRDGGDAPGYGVWRSTDGGLTWTPRNNGMGNRTVYEILMHPTNSNILIASTNGSRVYRSTDAGANWAWVSAGTNCKDIAFHPTDPNIVYGGGASFVRSTDNGQSFSTITSGVPSASRFAIGVSVDQPDWVYLLGGNGNGLVELIRSTDSGVNFTLRSNSPNILGWASDGSDVGSQAWYDLVLAVNPFDADELYTGGVNIWKSNDGGATMTLTGHWTGSGGADDVHADHHAMEFSPHNNDVYNGNDGGIYYSSNSGGIWNDITSGLAIAQVYKIGVAQTVEELAISGYQDNGTSVSEGTSFRTEIGGDGMECLIDPTDANYMYGSLYYGAIRRSTNYGFSFGNIAGGISEDGAWVTPFKLDPGNTSRMYAGFDNVWRTDDVKAGTVAWTQISTFTGTNNCRDLAVSPSDNDVIYVSRDRNGERFFKTSNATAGTPSWTNLSSNLPVNSTPRDIEIDPLDPDHLFIAQGTEIYESTDGGSSWTNFSGTLPNISLNTIVIDHNSPVEAMYVGMDVGVYYRDINMTDWEQYYSGFPNIEVTELNIYYNTTECKSMIYAGTYAQGLWKSDLKDPGTVAPIACFESDVQTGCTATPIYFTDLSSYTPTGWTWTFSPNTVTYVGGTNANSQNPEVEFNATGLYTVTLTATNGNGSDDEVKTDYINIINSVLTAPTLTAPADAATGVPAPAALTWTTVTGTSITYDIDIATDAAFSSIIDTQTGLTTNSYSATTLNSNTTYYWRVKAFESCAQSPFTTVFSFTTGDCNVYPSTDVPINIPSTGTPNVTSTLNVANTGTITGVSVVGLDITHTWINDLIITLESPSGTTITLLDQICGGQDDILVNLDDGAATSINAAPCPPTGGNNYQPDGTLSSFIGEAADGTWTLSVEDVFNADGGDINAWALSICTTPLPCTDPTAPTLSFDDDPLCPGASTALNISGTLNDATAWEIYTSSCGVGSIGNTTGAPVSISPGSTTTYYVRGEGGCVTPGACVQSTLTVEDVVTPSITCPGNQTEIANGSCQVTLPDYTGLATTTDNCGSVTVSQSPTPGTIISGAGTVQTVTLTADDGNGNTANCTFDVTVVDNTDPTISCPSDFDEPIDINCQFSIPDYTGLATEADNCAGSPTITQTPAVGTVISGVGTTQTITLTVNDGNGQTANCSFDITLIDNTGPDVTCPSITEINPTATCGMPDLTGGVLMSDNCDPSPVVISQSPAAGTAMAGLIGTNQLLTITATDASGNTGVCSVTLPVVDNIPPTITCPANQSESANGSCQVILPDYTGMAVVSDMCDPTPTVTQNPAPGTVITGIGTVQTVQLTVTDASSNFANCTFDVTIVDVTGPTVTCPGPVSATADAATCTASPALGTPTVTDCSSTTVTNDAPANFPVGTTTVTWTITDASSNATTCTQLVTISDNTPAQPGAISGANSVCSGDNETYSVAAVSGATGYTWTLPAGWSGTSSTNMINVVTGPNAGNVSVTADNACGSSASQSLAVTLQSAPAQPGLITGATTPCAGSSETYSISAVSGASSYIWTLPSGWTGTSTSTSITVTVSSTSGNVEVVAVGTCGNSSASTSSITVTDIPSAAGVITCSPGQVCVGSTTTCSIAPVTGAASYVWSLPSGWSGTSTTTSITATTGASGGNVTVTPTNSCGNGTASTEAVTTTDVPTASFSTSITGLTVTFADGSTNTPSGWSWDFGDSNNSTQHNPTHTYSVAGTYNVCLTSTNGCGTSVQTCQNVTVSGTGSLVWTGAVSTDWNNPLNWSPNTVPNYDNVTIPDVLNDPVLGPGVDGYVNDITCASGATITIQTGQTLSISGNWTWPGTHGLGGEVIFNGSTPQTTSGILNFTNLTVENDVSLGGSTSVSAELIIDGGTLTTNDQLTIASTASGTGWIMPYINGGTITGEITMQRYIPSSGFHYFGSAVNTPSITTDLNGLSLSGPNGGQIIPTAACSSTQIDPTSPYGRMFEWNPGNVFSTPCFYWGWNVRSTGTMTNARGYAGIFNGTPTLSISGSANNGTISYNGLANVGGTGNGFHLVSNAYPSPMLWTAPSGFDGAAYFWQNSGIYSGTYQPFLSGLGHQIASMQGFFVRVSGPTSNFTTTNAQRISGDPLFYREADNITESMTIKVSDGSYADKATLSFNEQANDAWDAQLDAKKIPGNSTQPIVYTRNTGDPLSINCIKPVSEEKYVILGFDHGGNEDGIFDFEFTVDVGTLPVVYLEDHSTGRSTLIEEGVTYQFRADGSSTEDRFVLHFYPKSISMDNPLLIYSSQDGLKVSSEDLNGSNITIMDVVGQVVHTQPLNGTNMTIPTNSWSEGTYFVKVSGILNKTQKVMVVR